MTDYASLMQIFSRPRPNGSRAERETSRFIQAWLQERGIPFRIHTFRHYPYFFEWIGLWLILSRGLLGAAIWLRWGWAALPIALIGLIGATVDQAFHLPLVTWPGSRKGENILIELGQPGGPEILFSAHYDSKTELLDHNQRMFFLKAIPLGVILSLALGLLGPLDAWLLAQAHPWAGATYAAAALLSIPLLFLASGMGLNMLLGRLSEPSQGAVDNGAACAILLGLAEKLNGQADGLLSQKRLTLALYTGEEVDRQGSRAYAASRLSGGEGWPEAVVNMEIMAQNGSYVYWATDGSVFHQAPTSPRVNQALCAAVVEVTGDQPLSVGPMISDAAPFLLRGVPTGVLGTYDRTYKDSGFHRPSDSLSRVQLERLEEGVEILSALALQLP
jgi:hypothetical protein